MVGYFVEGFFGGGYGEEVEVALAGVGVGVWDVGVEAVAGVADAPGGVGGRAVEASREPRGWPTGFYYTVEGEVEGAVVGGCGEVVGVAGVGGGLEVEGGDYAGGEAG